MKGKLIIFSGPSGVGKGTVRTLLSKFSELNLKFSVSYTTRKKRVGERDGIDYFFITKEEFQKKIEDNIFLEWAVFNENYYGTSKDFVTKLQDQGHNVILEIEVLGAKQIFSQLNDDYISIFLLPPSLEELEKRLYNRQTETPELIKNRLERAKEEIKLKDKYDYNVFNITPSKAAEEIKEIILNQKNKS